MCVASLLAPAPSPAAAAPADESTSIAERIEAAFAAVQENLVSLKDLVLPRRDRSLTADELTLAESTTASTISGLGEVLELRRSVSLPETTEDIEKTRRRVSFYQRILVCQSFDSKLAYVETSETPKEFRSRLVEALEYLQAHAKDLKLSEASHEIDPRAAKYFAGALSSLRYLVRNMCAEGVTLIDTVPTLKKVNVSEMNLDELAIELNFLIAHVQKPIFLQQARAKLEITYTKILKRKLFSFSRARHLDLEDQQHLVCSLLENLACYGALIACKATPDVAHPKKQEMFSAFIRSMQSALSFLRFNSRSFVDFIIDPLDIMALSEEEEASAGGSGASLSSSYATTVNSLFVSSVSSEDESHILRSRSSTHATHGSEDEDEFSDEARKIQYIMQNLPLLKEALRILRENRDFTQRDGDVSFCASVDSEGSSYTSSSGDYEE